MSWYIEILQGGPNDGESSGNKTDNAMQAGFYVGLPKP